MAAAIMATMQLAFTRTRLLGDACAQRANYAGCVCTQAYGAVSSVHVRQPGLVIDKIPGRSSDLGASGTLVAAVQHMRLNRAPRCSRPARWQQHNRAVSVLRALLPSLQHDRHGGPSLQKLNQSALDC